MSELLAGAWHGLVASSPWEFAAMVLAITYLILAVRQNIWCWAAAFVSTAIYLVIFYSARLYMDSALQVFYMVMAVYGWSQWRHHAQAERDLRISTRSVTWHAIIVAAVLVASATSGILLDRYSSAAYPYLDSLTTWASVFTTWMVARKILENWIYWIVIDSFSVYLYVNRGLYLTVILFLLYVFIAFLGLRQWRKDYRRAA